MPFTEEEKRERKNARQREYNKKTKYAAQRKYDKENAVQIAIRFYTPSDDDVIERIRSVENKTDYIRQLIRKDIEEKG